MFNIGRKFNKYFTYIQKLSKILLNYALKHITQEMNSY